MARRSNKSDNGEKKISGMNKFLYRGYEVYDSDGNPVQVQDTESQSGESVYTVKAEIPKDRTTGRQSVMAYNVDLVKNIIQPADGEKVLKEDKAKTAPKYKKRQIRDGKVWENLNNIADPIVRGGLSGTMFSGTVNQQMTEIKLSDTKREITPRLIISEIISMQQHIKLTDNCSSYVRYIDEGVEKTVAVHKNLITFLKAAIVSQYNASHEFSQIVSAFIFELVLEIISNNYVLPISTPAKSRLQEVILKELNDYCKELFDSCNIKYGEVVMEQTTKKSKKKAESLIDQLVESADTARV